MAYIAQCRVCGKDYEVCRSCKSGNGSLNWRAVACSPECGAKYFAAIQASRAKKPAEPKKSKAVVAEATPKYDRKGDHAFQTSTPKRSESSAGVPSEDKGEARPFDTPENDE